MLHKPKSTAGKRGGGADAGLQIGRFTDLLFRRVVAKEVKLDGTKYTHRRCARIMRNLETLGIVPLRTQLSVTLPHHKITTQLDGVGINKKNELVVLEIKVRHGEAERGEAERGDAEHGDAERGDAEHGWSVGVQLTRVVSGILVYTI